MKQKSVKKKLSQVADSKLKLADMQLAVIESELEMKKEEHQTKINHLERKHVIKMEIL